MIDPCHPCVWRGNCEHCHFGYHSPEMKHELMYELLADLAAGRESRDLYLAKNYAKLHPSWREEILSFKEAKMDGDERKEKSMNKWQLDFYLTNGEKLLAIYEGPECNSTEVAKKLLQGPGNDFMGFAGVNMCSNLFIRRDMTAAMDISVYHEEEKAIEKTVLPSPEQWEIIIEGMRNPHNSWDKMDSGVCSEMDCADCEGNMSSKCYDIPENHYILGPNDHKLMTDLAKGGPVHAKYRRMIPVWVTINAPLYWWKEFDTYKIGTVSNSCSTMHKIHSEKFTRDDFSFDEDLMDEEIIIDIDEIDDEDKDFINHTHFDIQVDRTVDICEYLRKMFNHYAKRAKSEDCTESERAHFTRAAKKCWRMLIQYLPTSYNQKRTIFLDYEVLVGIYTWRKNHKLTEWHTLCDWIEQLPYSELITGEVK